MTNGGGWSRAMVVAGLWVAAPEAHAYLDPGSGSLLLQILLGGLAGIGVLAKLYWHRIREFFGVRDAEDRGTEEKEHGQREESK